MKGNSKKIGPLIKIYFIIIILIFSSLAVRLFYLQVVNMEVFKTKSQQNMIRLIEIKAKRGDILDRNNQVLATSKPVFSITLSNLDSEEEEKKTIKKLVEILNDSEITVEKIEEQMSKNARKFEPIEITRILWGSESIKLISKLEENRNELLGVNILEEPMRYYPNNFLAGHILGFVGSINEQELEKYGREYFGLNDKIGKTGLEKVFDFIMQKGKQIGLKGKKGAQRIEVNARNQVVRDLPLIIQPSPGNNLVLTIDGKLQKTMDETMDLVIEDLKKTNPKASAGAGVVIDVKTGAILAMSSKPNINPNDFVDGSYPDKRDYYNDKKIKPQLNRAISAAYPPGSTFKMITAMAGLASGKIHVDDPPINCRGSFWKPPYISCWKTHGHVDFYSALAESCNTYFQYVGDTVGIEMIDKVANEFGLGEKTGLKDLSGELKGVLPTPERKAKINKKVINSKHERNVKEIEEKYLELILKTKNDSERKKIEREKKQALIIEESRYKNEYSFYVNWKPYETYNTSIGQGDNNYTMLQLANYVATIANGGKRFRPYLVQKIVSPEGKVLEEFKPIVEHTVSLDHQILSETRKAMLAVTQPGGTAAYIFRNFPENIQVAAKTGTAQTGRVGDNKDKDFHGVFVAFAPYDDPQIAYAGIVEYGQHGGSSAGIVSKAVFEQYFGLTLTENLIKERILISPLEEE